jgi:phage gp36-like protein
LIAYASPSDLSRLGVGAAATSGISAADIVAALDAASSLAGGYLAKQFTLPLASWGDDLRRVVCMVAAYDIIGANRGFNPENGSDITLRVRYEDAIRWLERVAAGDIVPIDIIDATPDEDGQPLMEGEPALGWLWPSSTEAD